MTRSIRLAIVLSTCWLAAVLLVVLVEYALVMPGQCIAGDKEAMRIFMPLTGIFLSCSWFSDLAGEYWWGVALLRVRDQIIEVSVVRLLFAAVFPVAVLWFMLVVAPRLTRWVRGGA